MYLALILLLLAAAVLFQPIWLLLTTAGLWFVLDKIIITQEERDI